MNTKNDLKMKIIMFTLRIYFNIGINGELDFFRLFEMALDFFNIQPMLAECERLFSSAGQMMIPQRTAFDAVILSICQYLRS
jgi:hypothetical protein